MEMIEKKSGGKLKVTVFPGGAGKPADHRDMAENGVVDISWGTDTYTAGRFPPTSAMDLPFQANSAEAPAARAGVRRQASQKEHAKAKALWLQSPRPSSRTWPRSLH